MKKYSFIIALILSFTLNAQDTIRVKMKPMQKYKRVSLSQLEVVNKRFVTYNDSKTGEYKLVMPKEAVPGMYRIIYDYKNNKFIDFLYNKEEVDLEFHPDYPESLVTFKKSKENKLYQDYIEAVYNVQNKLDSVQVTYFQTKDTKEEAVLTKMYTESLVDLELIQNKFTKKMKGTLASHFITANKRHFNKTLIKNTDTYLTNLKTHYFDYINFENKSLAKSSIFIDRILDYVFYLTNSKNPETVIKLQKEAVTDALSKITSVEIKKGIIESLLYTFAQQEKKVITDYIFKNHFGKLPVAYQDFEFKHTINDMFKTTIGLQAPDINWDIYGKTHNLYGLKKSKYYVVVFWGSTCPHCLVELPNFNKYLADKKDITTVAVGIENISSKPGWKEETFYLENMTHALALGSPKNKWKENKTVHDYGVDGTPMYFVLDSDKKIIGKPYDFKKLKIFFEALEKNKVDKTKTTDKK